MERETESQTTVQNKQKQLLWKNISFKKLCWQKREKSLPWARSASGDGGERGGVTESDCPLTTSQIRSGVPQSQSDDVTEEVGGRWRFASSLPVSQMFWTCGHGHGAEGRFAPSLCFTVRLLLIHGVGITFPSHGMLDFDMTWRVHILRQSKVFWLSSVGFKGSSAWSLLFWCQLDKFSGIYRDESASEAGLTSQNLALQTSRKFFRKWTTFIRLRLGLRGAGLTRL